MFKTMPVISSMMILAMLAITGFPFLNGYISKSLLMYALEGNIRYWVIFGMNIGTATLFVKMSQIFFGPKALSYPIPHFRQSVPLFILALSILGIGNYLVYFEGTFLGMDFTAFSPASLSAFVDYFITIGLAVIIYHYLVRPDKKPVKALRGFTLSFEHANYIFILYAVVLAAYFIVFGLFF